MSSSKTQPNLNLEDINVKVLSRSPSAASCSRPKSSNINLAFGEDKPYLILFDEFMACRKARCVFEDFLREETFNQEPIMFLNELEHYGELYGNVKKKVLQRKKQRKFDGDVKMLFKKAGWMDSYVKANSVKELNLGFLQTSTMTGWSTVVEMQTKLNSDVTLDKIDREKIEDDLFVLLDPNSLFGKVKLSVVIDLKFSQFPRFVQSERLTRFLSTNGERFTRMFSIDMSLGYGIDIRYKAKDFQSKIVADRDIFLGFNLLENSPDWQIILDRNDVTTFVSRKSYILGKMEMSLGKQILKLSFPIEQVWDAFCDKESRSFIEMNNMGDWSLLDYIPPSGQTLIDFPLLDREEVYNDKEPPLALQLAAYGIDLRVPLMKNRDFPHAMTTIFDPGLNGYVSLLHSAHIEKHPVQSNRVETCMLMYYFLISDGPNLTRVIQIIYSDFHIPLAKKELLRTLVKIRGVDLKERFDHVLKQRSTESRPVNDFLQYRRAVTDNASCYPNRSWYTEYKRKRE